MNGNDDIPEQTEFSKWEWYEVMKVAVPEITLEEYEEAWAEFAEKKRQHGIHLV